MIFLLFWLKSIRKNLVFSQLKISSLRFCDMYFVILILYYMDYLVFAFMWILIWTFDRPPTPFHVHMVYEWIRARTWNIWKFSCNWNSFYFAICNATRYIGFKLLFQFLQWKKFGTYSHKRALKEIRFLPLVSKVLFIYNFHL